MKKSANGNSWRSSFEPDWVISSQQGVVTAVSGSSGFGKHASLFLEHYEHVGDPYPKTELYDVYNGGSNNKVKIQTFDCHYMQNNEIEVTFKIPKVTDKNEAVQGTGGAGDTHHHSYLVDRATILRVKAAVERFKTKSENGRYVYSHPGGALGFVFSKIGQRGVNCADFVIKVLAEANVAKISNNLFNSPYRIAS